MPADGDKDRRRSSMDLRERKGVFGVDMVCWDELSIGDKFVFDPQQEIVVASSVGFRCFLGVAR